MSHAVQGHPTWMGHIEEFWQNVVHWRRKWQPTPVFLLWKPHEQYKAKRYDTGWWTRSDCVQYTTGEGNGNPLQYSCLENSMDGGAWWATVHGVTKGRTRLSDFTILLGKSGRQLQIAPKRMKWLGQSRNNAQLWMCLVVKIKSDAVKNNIAKKLGMLGPRIMVNWTWSSRRKQEWILTS